ncbi:hypothetical protein ACWEN6_25095 [Sphaerisporangium sp. NPDC004334]
MSGLYPFTHDQGTTLDRTLTYKNAAGAPIDITGWTGRMQIRSSSGRTLYATLASAGEADGTITLGGAAGTIRLLVAASATSGWQFRLAYYDLELTYPSATPPLVRRLLHGPFVLSPEVTT